MRKKLPQSGVEYEGQNQTKPNFSAMLAAEAGYEKVVFWMSQEQDMLSALQEELCGERHDYRLRGKRRF